MIFEDPELLKRRIEEVTPRKVYGEPEIHTDTSSYMAIDAGSVLRLGGHDYYVMGDTKEGRFGIDDQPKFWVKFAVDLTTGQSKIIKLVFHEQFKTNVGPIKIHCQRSPSKESRVLELVQGNPRFMQGVTVTDAAGNLVRVIDMIRGRSFFNYIYSLELDHETYYHQQLPQVMTRLIPCIEAMAQVHHQGSHHGDIRNDHILVDSSSEDYAWIDFDYQVNFTDYDVWSMGNVITYAVGKGIHTFRGVKRRPEDYPASDVVLDENDAMVFYDYRVANLRKLYPYVDQRLNNILMRFTKGCFDFYEDLDSQARDLREVFG